MFKRHRFEVPKSSPDSTIPQKTSRTQHTLILMVMIYFNKRTQTKTSKEKARRAKSGGHQARASSILSQRNHRTLPPPETSCDNRGVVLTRDAHWASEPRDLTLAAM